jgi:cytochrome c peroxidase
MGVASIIRRSLLLILVTGMPGFSAAQTAAGTKDDDYRNPPAMVVPPDNQITPARVELGKALFFDPRLSGPQWVSCATCHYPYLGWADGLAVGFGEEAGKPSRGSPSLVNVGYSKILMWDGRRSSLEDQVLKSRNMKVSGMETRISVIQGYRELFDRAYPGEGVTQATIAKAIATFERTIISSDTPFDRWQKGDARAVSESAKRGFTLFRGKAKCDACHQGYNFTDDGFHNIGVKTLPGMMEDIGRYEHRKVKSMKGAFRTPGLREIVSTAPYMHNGVYKTLEEVVDHYDRGGDVKDNLDPNMSELNLTAQEKSDLVNFMKSLTSKSANFAIPRLPQ